MGLTGEDTACLPAAEPKSGSEEKSMKKLTKLSIFFALLSMFSLSTVHAASVTVNGTNFFLNSDTTSATLDSTAGMLQAKSSGIVFGTVTINMASTIAAITSSDYIRVDDNRGNNSGWNVTVSATDFTATAIPDLSATGTLTVTIPSSSILTLSSQNPSALFSTESANVIAQSTSNTTVTSGSGIKVLNAAKGYGQGVYKQKLDYTLTMPNYLPAASVITATDAASQFIAPNRTVGAQIGLFSGTYTSTISYSITTGP
jgi:hypothetical protein